MYTIEFSTYQTSLLKFKNHKFENLKLTRAFYYVRKFANASASEPIIYTVFNGRKHYVKIPTKYLY